MEVEVKGETGEKRDRSCVREYLSAFRRVAWIERE